MIDDDFELDTVDPIEARDGRDPYDREFEAHFRVLTARTRPLGDRRLRSGEDIYELARELEDRYPDPDEDPKHLALVKRSRGVAGGLLESSQRRRVRSSPKSDPEIDQLEQGDEPVPATSQSKQREIEAKTLDDLDRILGVEQEHSDDVSSEEDTDYADVDADAETIEEAVSPRSRAYTPPAKSVDHCSPPVINRALVRLCPDIDMGGGRFVPGIALDPAASTSGLQIVRAQHYCYGPDHNHPDYPRRDGLAESWADIIGGSGVVYVNPPYGRVITRWTTKAIDEMLSADNLSVIMLLPNRTETAWFQEMVLRPGTASRVCWVRGRLKFVGNPNGAPFGSVVVLYTLDQDLAEQFEHVFGEQVDDVLERPLGIVTRIAA